jgi:hypothetical protein
MKKVAIVLSLSALIVLILACGGGMANRGHLSASHPDELPIYLITLGNLREAPVCTSSTQSYVVNETENDPEKMPLGKIQAVLKMALQFYQHNINK